METCKIIYYSSDQDIHKHLSAWTRAYENIAAAHLTLAATLKHECSRIDKTSKLTYGKGENINRALNDVSSVFIGCLKNMALHIENEWKGFDYARSPWHLLSKLDNKFEVNLEHQFLALMSERKHKEDALRKAEKKYLKSVDDWSLMVVKNGRFSPESHLDDKIFEQKDTMQRTYINYRDVLDDEKEMRATFINGMKALQKEWYQRETDVMNTWRNSAQSFVYRLRNTAPIPTRPLYEDLHHGIVQIDVKRLVDHTLADRLDVHEFPAQREHWEELIKKKKANLIKLSSDSGNESEDDNKSSRRMSKYRERRPKSRQKSTQTPENLAMSRTSPRMSRRDQPTKSKRPLPQQKDHLEDNEEVESLYMYKAGPGKEKSRNSKRENIYKVVGEPQACSTPKRVSRKDQPKRQSGEQSRKQPSSSPVKSIMRSKQQDVVAPEELKVVEVKKDINLNDGKDGESFVLSKPEKDVEFRLVLAFEGLPQMKTPTPSAVHHDTCCCCCCHTPVPPRINNGPQKPGDTGIAKGGSHLEPSQKAADLRTAFPQSNNQETPREKSPSKEAYKGLPHQEKDLEELGTASSYKREKTRASSLSKGKDVLRAKPSGKQENGEVPHQRKVQEALSKPAPQLDQVKEALRSTPLEKQENTKALPQRKEIPKDKSSERQAKAKEDRYEVYEVKADKMYTKVKVAKETIPEKFETPVQEVLPQRSEPKQSSEPLNVKTECLKPLAKDLQETVPVKEEKKPRKKYTKTASKSSTADDSSSDEEFVQGANRPTRRRKLRKETTTLSQKVVKGSSGGTPNGQDKHGDDSIESLSDDSQAKKFRPQIPDVEPDEMDASDLDDELIAIEKNSPRNKLMKTVVRPRAIKVCASPEQVSPGPANQKLSISSDSAFEHYQKSSDSSSEVSSGWSPVKVVPQVKPNTFDHRFQAKPPVIEGTETWTKKIDKTLIKSNTEQEADRKVDSPLDIQKEVFSKDQSGVSKKTESKQEILSPEKTLRGKSLERELKDKMIQEKDIPKEEHSQIKLSQKINLAEQAKEAVFKNKGKKAEEDKTAFLKSEVVSKDSKKKPELSVSKDLKKNDASSSKGNRKIEEMDPINYQDKLKILSVDHNKDSKDTKPSGKINSTEETLEQKDGESRRENKLVDKVQTKSLENNQLQSPETVNSDQAGENKEDLQSSSSEQAIPRRYITTGPYQHIKVDISSTSRSGSYVSSKSSTTTVEPWQLELDENGVYYVKDADQEISEGNLEQESPEKGKMSDQEKVELKERSSETESTPSCDEYDSSVEKDGNKDTPTEEDIDEKQPEKMNWTDRAKEMLFRNKDKKDQEDVKASTSGSKSEEVFKDSKKSDETISKEQKKTAEKEQKKTTEKEQKKTAEKEQKKTSDKEQKKDSEKEQKKDSDKEQKKTAEKEQKKTAEKEQKKTAEKEQKKTAEKEQKKSAEKEQKKSAEKEQKKSAEKEQKKSAEKEQKKSAEKEQKKTAEKEQKKTAEKEQKKTAEKEQKKTAEKEEKKNSDKKQKKTKDKKQKKTSEKEEKKTSDKEEKKSSDKEQRKSSDKETSKNKKKGKIPTEDDGKEDNKSKSPVNKNLCGEKKNKDSNMKVEKASTSSSKDEAKKEKNKESKEDKKPLRSSSKTRASSKGFFKGLKESLFNRGSKNEDSSSSDSDDSDGENNEKKKSLNPENEDNPFPDVYTGRMDMDKMWSLLGEMENEEKEVTKQMEKELGEDDEIVLSSTECGKIVDCYKDKINKPEKEKPLKIYSGKGNTINLVERAKQWQEEKKAEAKRKEEEKEKIRQAVLQDWSSSSDSDSDLVADKKFPVSGNIFMNGLPQSPPRPRVNLVELAKQKAEEKKRKQEEDEKEKEKLRKAAVEDWSTSTDSDIKELLEKKTLEQGTGKDMPQETEEGTLPPQKVNLVELAKKRAEEKKEREEQLKEAEDKKEKENLSDWDSDEEDVFKEKEKPESKINLVELLQKRKSQNDDNSQEKSTDKEKPKVMFILDELRIAREEEAMREAEEKEELAKSMGEEGATESKEKEQDNSGIMWVREQLKRKNEGRSDEYDEEVVAKDKGKSETSKSTTSQVRGENQKKKVPSILDILKNNTDVAEDYNSWDDDSDVEGTLPSSGTKQNKAQPVLETMKVIQSKTDSSKPKDLMKSSSLDELLDKALSDNSWDSDSHEQEDGKIPSANSKENKPQYDLELKKTTQSKPDSSKTKEPLKTSSLDDLLDIIGLSESDKEDEKNSWDSDSTDKEDTIHPKENKTKSVVDTKKDVQPKNNSTKTKESLNNLSLDELLDNAISDNSWDSDSTKKEDGIQSKQSKAQADSETKKNVSTKNDSKSKEPQKSSSVDDFLDSLEFSSETDKEDKKVSKTMNQNTKDIIVSPSFDALLEEYDIGMETQKEDSTVVPKENKPSKSNDIIVSPSFDALLEEYDIGMETDKENSTVVPKENKPSKSNDIIVSPSFDALLEEYDIGMETQKENSTVVPKENKPSKSCDIIVSPSMDALLEEYDIGMETQKEDSTGVPKENKPSKSCDIIVSPSMDALLEEYDIGMETQKEDSTGVPKENKPSKSCDIIVSPSMDALLEEYDIGMETQKENSTVVPKEKKVTKLEEGKDEVNSWDSDSVESETFAKTPKHSEITAEPVPFFGQLALTEEDSKVKLGKARSETKMMSSSFTSPHNEADLTENTGNNVSTNLEDKIKPVKKTSQEKEKFQEEDKIENVQATAGTSEVGLEDTKVVEEVKSILKSGSSSRKNTNPSSPENKPSRSVSFNSKVEVKEIEDRLTVLLMENQYSDSDSSDTDAILISTDDEMEEMDDYYEKMVSSPENQEEKKAMEEAETGPVTPFEAKNKSEETEVTSEKEKKIVAQDLGIPQESKPEASVAAVSTNEGFKTQENQRTCASVKDLQPQEKEESMTSINEFNREVDDKDVSEKPEEKQTDFPSTNDSELDQAENLKPELYGPSKSPRDNTEISAHSESLDSNKPETLPVFEAEEPIFEEDEEVAYCTPQPQDECQTQPTVFVFDSLRDRAKSDLEENHCSDQDSDSLVQIEKYLSERDMIYDELSPEEKAQHHVDYDLLVNEGMRRKREKNKALFELARQRAEFEEEEKAVEKEQVVEEVAYEYEESGEEEDFMIAKPAESFKYNPAEFERENTKRKPNYYDDFRLHSYETSSSDNSSSDQEPNWRKVMEVENKPSLPPLKSEPLPQMKTVDLAKSCSRDEGHTQAVETMAEILKAQGRTKPLGPISPHGGLSMRSSLDERMDSPRDSLGNLKPLKPLIKGLGSKPSLPNIGSKPEEADIWQDNTEETSKSFWPSASAVGARSDFSPQKSAPSILRLKNEDVSEGGYDPTSLQSPKSSVLPKSSLDNAPFQQKVLPGFSPLKKSNQLAPLDLNEVKEKEKDKKEKEKAKKKKKKEKKKTETTVKQVAEVPPMTMRPSAQEVNNHLATISQGFYGNDEPGFTSSYMDSQELPVGMPVASPISQQAYSNFGRQESHPVSQQWPEGIPAGSPTPRGLSARQDSQLLTRRHSARAAEPVSPRRLLNRRQQNSPQPALQPSPEPFGRTSIEQEHQVVEEYFEDPFGTPSQIMPRATGQFKMPSIGSSNSLVNSPCNSREPSPEKKVKNSGGRKFSGIFDKHIEEKKELAKIPEARRYNMMQNIPELPNVPGPKVPVQKPVMVDLRKIDFKERTEYVYDEEPQETVMYHPDFVDEYGNPIPVAHVKQPDLRKPSKPESLLSRRKQKNDAQSPGRLRRGQMGEEQKPKQPEIRNRVVFQQEEEPEMMEMPGVMVHPITGEPMMMHPGFEHEGFIPPEYLEQFPEGFDPRMFPPGFHPQMMPEGFDPRELPPGFHPQMMHEGFDPRMLPPGFDPRELPPGFHPEMMPERFDPRMLPPGFHPEMLPEGMDPEQLPPGYQYVIDPENLPPGVHPDQLQYVYEDGGEERQLPPGFFESGQFDPRLLPPGVTPEEFYNNYGMLPPQVRYEEPEERHYIPPEIMDHCYPGMTIDEDHVLGSNGQPMTRKDFEAFEEQERQFLAAKSAELKRQTKLRKAAEKKQKKAEEKKKKEEEKRKKKEAKMCKTSTPEAATVSSAEVTNRPQSSRNWKEATAPPIKASSDQRFTNLMDKLVSTVDKVNKSGFLSQKPVEDAKPKSGGLPGFAKDQGMTTSGLNHPGEVHQPWATELDLTPEQVENLSPEKRQLWDSANKILDETFGPMTPQVNRSPMKSNWEPPKSTIKINCARIDPPSANWQPPSGALGSQKSNRSEMDSQKQDGKKKTSPPSSPSRYLKSQKAVDKLLSFGEAEPPEEEVGNRIVVEKVLSVWKPEVQAPPLRPLSTKPDSPSRFLKSKPAVDISPSVDQPEEMTIEASSSRFLKRKPEPDSPSRFLKSKPAVDISPSVDQPEEMTIEASSSRFLKRKPELDSPSRFLKSKPAVDISPSVDQPEEMTIEASSSRFLKRKPEDKKTSSSDKPEESATSVKKPVPRKQEPLSDVHNKPAPTSHGRMGERLLNRKSNRPEASTPKVAPPKSSSSTPAPPTTAEVKPSPSSRSHDGGERQTQQVDESRVKVESSRRKVEDRREKEEKKKEKTGDRQKKEEKKHRKKKASHQKKSRGGGYDDGGNTSDDSFPSLDDPIYQL